MLFDVFPQQAQIHFSICAAVQDKLPRISALRHMVPNSNSHHRANRAMLFRSLDEGFPPKMRGLGPDSAQQQHTPLKRRRQQLLEE
jgi:hypothetical protein